MISYSNVGLNIELKKEMFDKISYATVIRNDNYSKMATISMLEDLKNKISRIFLCSSFGYTIKI